MLSEGRTGLISAADGTVNPLRLDGTGALTIVAAHALYSEAVLRGNMFTVCSQAGVTSQAGLSATTPVLTLFNPLGSGINGILVYAGCVITVAAATCGAVWLAANTVTQSAAVTGTLSTTMRNCLLGGKAPTLTPLLAATLPAAPVGISILGTLQTGAVTVQIQTIPMGRYFDGSVVIAPGTAVSIQTGVATGASGLFCEYIWEEVGII